MMHAERTPIRPCSKLLVGNNTTADLRDLGLWDAVAAFVRFGDPLPEEVADLFEVRLVEAEDGWRGIVEWA